MNCLDSDIGEPIKAAAFEEKDALIGVPVSFYEDPTGMETPGTGACWFVRLERLAQADDDASGFREATRGDQGRLRSGVYLLRPDKENQTRNGDRYAGEYFGDKIYGLESTTLPMIIAMRDRSMKVARKAAENVIHLRRVDKQVTKAVMAANRAATAARVAVVKAIQNRMDGKFCDLDI
ncbi:hypothetical protein CDL15_Pgr006491 [Punica granatum]|uniref:Uncharacterized protein n=1 Tax=Punica granatum TaxID=22663 RepID=A0A218XZC7_PUNGR|nr:hypothetical protein CDL15_Pgr006491 [Punica granatum]